eukprot:scaffold2188_cov102-Isochrysis_galbana.AAC.3
MVEEANLLPDQRPERQRPEVARQVLASGAEDAHLAGEQRHHCHPDAGVDGGPEAGVRLDAVRVGAKERDGQLCEGEAQGGHRATIEHCEDGTGRQERPVAALLQPHHPPEDPLAITGRAGVEGSAVGPCETVG